MEFFSYADSLIDSLWSIVSADGWMRHESRRIARNTRIAARLADESRRADRVRTQRGKWM